MSDASPVPTINFNPALSLQRQELLLQTLRQYQPKSVIDIGCGQGSLLACLCNCDDALPVELLVGLDISLPTLEEASSAIKWVAESQQQEGRWRPLDVTLLRGKFTKLELDKVQGPKFDAIVSSEVIEHLDPPDLARYWDIHLGAMAPQKLIVTTPNRDFNTLFETVETLSSTTGQSYRREGVEYRMRHDDHRFEYTRTEFEEACHEAAVKFGYTVSFTGVGTAYNALHQCPQVLEQFPELKLLGYCTQAAIFTTTAAREVAIDTTSTPVILWGDLEIVTYKSYPRNVWDDYPPARDTIESILWNMWPPFVPEYHAKNKHPGFQASAAAKLLDATYSEQDKVVVCQVSLAKLWDFNYSLQKKCRFNKGVFCAIGRQLLDSGARSSPVVCFFDCSLDVIAVRDRDDAALSF